jgi:histidine ammonia-lyase
MLVLTGNDLRPSDLRALAADGPLDVTVDPGALAAVASGHERSVAVAERRPVYGRSTGVGANRSVDVAAEDRTGHGVRLLRSHAHGIGEPMPQALVRAAMVVRANQIACGMAGLRADLLGALLAAVRDGRSVTAPRVGSVGTADLALLAELGLALQGEQPWSDGTVRRYLDGDFLPDDALPFISSNAATIALATLATGRLSHTLRAAHAVAALSFVALRGNLEAYAPAVHAARPHPGVGTVAALMRRLLDGCAPAARLQDPYGLRCLPQLHGPLVDALASMDATLAIEMNAAVENPLFVGGDALHHGGFHNAQLATGLDHVRLCAAQVAAMSLARLTKLNDPSFTGQRAFLAAGPAGSSGTMMVEYSAAGALSDVRSAAQPVSLHGVVLSLGMEDHASWAWQAAGKVDELDAALRQMLACELVVALRSLRLDGPERVVPPALTAVAEAAVGAVPHEPDDHRLADDLAAALAVLPSLAHLVTSAA